MITTWIIILTLSMASYGGPVLARVELVDQPSCEKFRALIMKQMGITSEDTNKTKADATKAIVSPCERWTR